MQKTIKSIIQLTACLALAVALNANAQDKKIDLTGNWKSSSTNQDGAVRETTFKFKAEGERLTGTISGRNADTAIEEGTIKGGELSFKVTREFNGTKMVMQYTGKVSGDTITGKSESERDGEKRSRDWVASAKWSRPKPLPSRKQPSSHYRRARRKNLSAIARRFRLERRAIFCADDGWGTMSSVTW